MYNCIKIALWLHVERKFHRINGQFQSVYMFNGIDEVLELDRLRYSFAKQKYVFYLFASAPDPLYRL